jgi:magnesium chelatase subunit D
MTNQYPFTAIVGQEKLKKALLLCAVNPSIGGVLIKGEKGTAKTTAVRGLAEVMPLVVKEKNALFPDDESEGFRAVPFVDLPLGASEDRVLGSLDLQAIVSERKKKFLPGLLAAAHRGILYIDEVNLLQDHLVDILLDVSASGINTVQREGMSVSHPSKFILIGTMNPEEGNLRPQFLDRFGLMVEVESQMDVNERTEVVRRRIAFENNPDAFCEKWEVVQQNQQKQIARAQKLLPDVEMPDGLLNLISQLCIEWSVFSLRADIVLYKTSVTLAAMAGRKTVTAEDVKEAAELVLLHRRGKKPAGQTQKPNSGNDSENNGPDNKSSQNNGGGLSNSESEPDLNESGECGEPDNCVPTQVFAIGQETEVPNLKSLMPSDNILSGRRSKVINTPKGFQVRSERKESLTNIDYSQTVKQALVRNPDQLSIQKEDLHQKVRHGKSGNLILFVVDASGSMAAAQRMAAVKGSVLSLLKDAYQKRDMVGVIAFRGVEAEILLEPTFSIDLAERALESLPTGGRTPLAHALQLTVQVLDQHKGGITPLLVILSDGKANVPLQGGGDAWKQVAQLSAGIMVREVCALVLDTEQGYLKFGRAAELAAALGGECITLDSLSADGLTNAVLDRLEV